MTEKALAAKSAEEIAGLLKAEGQEVTQAQADKLFEEARIQQGEVQKLTGRTGRCLRRQKRLPDGRLRRDRGARQQLLGPGRRVYGLPYEV